MIASWCQKPIRYVGCIFILLSDRIIGNLVAARAIGKTNSPIVWFLENELNCHDDDDDDTFIKVSKL